LFIEALQNARARGAGHDITEQAGGVLGGLIISVGRHGAQAAGDARAGTDVLGKELQHRILVGPALKVTVGGGGQL
jgi:hypothetical protein